MLRIEGFQGANGQRREISRRVLPVGRRGQEVVLVSGNPRRMLVSMDQDFGQLAGAVGFVVVMVNVRSRRDEPRHHRGSKEQKGGKSLPYTHAAILA